jgi:hypothetical protein
MFRQDGHLETELALLMSNGVVSLLQDTFSNRIYYILFLFPVECAILISASVPITVLHFYLQD